MKVTPMSNTKVVACPNLICQKRVTVTKDGYKMRCPHCGTTWLVPTKG